VTGDGGRGYTELNREAAKTGRVIHRRGHRDHREEPERLWTDELAIGGSVANDTSISQHQSKSHLGKSVIAFLFMPPTGIVAIIYSMRSISAWPEHPERAFDYSLRAAHWGMLSLVLWVVLMFVAPVICFVLAEAIGIAF